MWGQATTLMRFAAIVLGLAVASFGWAREMTVVNLAIVPGGGPLELAINQGQQTQLGYRQVATVEVQPSDRLTVRSMAESSQVTKTVGAVGSTDLLVISGGINGHPLDINVVSDSAGFADVNPNENAIAATKVCESSACVQVLHFAPVPGRTAQFGGPEVSLDLSCHRFSTGAGEASFRVGLALTYGEFGSFGAAASPNFAVWTCGLDGVRNLTTATGWPAIDGIDVPYERPARVFVAGDGVEQPLELLTFDGRHLGQSSQPIDPAVLLPRSQRTWHDLNESGRGLLIEPIGGDRAWLVIEYFHDAAGNPRWLSYVVQRDTQVSSTRYFGQQYRSERQNGEVISVPIADAEFLLEGETMRVTTFGHNSTETRRYGMSQDS